MKYIELKDSQTGLPVYVNAESVNAVYSDKDIGYTAVDVQSSVLFVQESARNVLNTLYQANFEKGFLFHAAEERRTDAGGQEGSGAVAFHKTAPKYDGLRRV